MNATQIICHETVNVRSYGIGYSSCHLSKQSGGFTPAEGSKHPISVHETVHMYYIGSETRVLESLFGSVLCMSNCVKRFHKNPDPVRVNGCWRALPLCLKNEIVLRIHFPNYVNHKSSKDKVTGLNLL